MTGQMSIYDWLGSLQEIYPDINSISEAEAVQIVSEKTGIPFKYRDDFWGWQAKQGKSTIRLKYNNFSVGNHERFFGLDASTNIEGIGCPCSGIEEVIKRVEAWIERIGK